MNGQETDSSPSRPENGLGGEAQKALDSITFEANFNRGYTDVSRLIEKRDKFVGQGLITTEQANTLPAVKAAAERTLAGRLQQDAVHSAAFNTEDFIRTRDTWIEAGIITLEEANKFPKVRGIAQHDLFSAAAAVHSDKDFVGRIKQRYVEAGILSESEAEKLVQEGDAKRKEHRPGA